jgi:hypothetical protein
MDPVSLSNCRFCVVSTGDRSNSDRRCRRNRPLADLLLWWSKCTPHDCSQARPRSQQISHSGALSSLLCNHRHRRRCLPCRSHRCKHHFGRVGWHTRPHPGYNPYHRTPGRNHTRRNWTSPNKCHRADTGCCCTRQCLPRSCSRRTPQSTRTRKRLWPSHCLCYASHCTCRRSNMGGLHTRRRRHHSWPHCSPPRTHT